MQYDARCHQIGIHLRYYDVVDDLSFILETVPTSPNRNIRRETCNIRSLHNFAQQLPPIMPSMQTRKTRKRTFAKNLPRTYHAVRRFGALGFRLIIYKKNTESAAR